MGDLARRMPLSRDGLEALVKGGACDCFGGKRRDLLWELGLAYRPQSVPGTNGEAKQLPLWLETAATPELRDLSAGSACSPTTVTRALGGHAPARAAPRTPPAGDLSSGELRARARTAARWRLRGWRSRRSGRRPRRASSSCSSEDELGRVCVSIVPPRTSTSGTARLGAYRPLVLARGGCQEVGENRGTCSCPSSSRSARWRPRGRRGRATRCGSRCRAPHVSTPR